MASADVIAPAAGTARSAPPVAEPDIDAELALLLLREPAPRAAPPTPAPGSGRSEAVLAGRQRIAYWALAALWVAVTVRFWAWFLRPEHAGAIGLQLTAGLCLAYLTTVLPSFYWFFVGRMRRPLHVEPAPDLRVAMITPCVPSHESLDIIEGQLVALAAVDYPHDSWILDEGGDPRIRRLAGRYGVRYFTRKGIARYNQPGPPFQARTKAGNVNAWLDHVDALGIEYDAFVQLDIDHRPRPCYLERTLGHLADPRVAWVQAPSVCANLGSWTARGLAEQDLVLQGPLQMGFYGHSGTPFIIGSHTTYRTSAVRAIGGFQPTRAEDHLDTVVLAAEGYRGVYVPEIIAEGDGPTDLSTYLGQQFAWAYSMVQIFLQHTPRLIRRYNLRQAFQFLMAQSWYTLWSLSLAVLWLLPVIALLTGHPIARVALGEFLAYQWTVVLTALLMWWASRRWFQPRGIGLTWRGMLLEAARWPVVLWAVINVVLGIRRPYMITPKGGAAGRARASLRIYIPYVTLALVGCGAIALALTIGTPGSTRGYIVLVLLNAAVFAALIGAATMLDLRDLLRGGERIRDALAARASMLAVAALVTSLTAATVVLAWAPLAEVVG